jgi:tetratricopeptide (TPR) repeat protein
VSHVETILLLAKYQLFGGVKKTGQLWKLPTGFKETKKILKMVLNEERFDGLEEEKKSEALVCLNPPLPSPLPLALPLSPFHPALVLSSHPSQYLIGVCYHNLHKLSRAMELWQKARKLNSKNENSAFFLEISYQMGRVYMRQGNVKEAKNIFLLIR